MAGISRGAAGEVLAARYLRKKGYQLLAANYRSRFGEIDIIAADEKYIAFVEVKLRGDAAIYTPQEAVTPAKQQKIICTALLYMQMYPSDLQPRFDVISIVTDGKDPMKVRSLTHLPAAFDAGSAHATF